MSKQIRLKDLPIKSSMVKKHKRVYKTLWIITGIIFLPNVILQLINDSLDFIINKFIILRSIMVFRIFKAIYKKEIIEKEKEMGWIK